MSRVYTNFKAHELKNEQLAGMVRKLQNLTEDGYEAIERNYALFEASYKRILPLSKQEEEWYLYFYTMYELISLYARHEKYDEVVKFAELFYRETALHMDRELPNYPGTDMSFLNTWIYQDIFRAYYYYHQIDDKKMEAFMEIYEEGAIKYGKTYTYYEAEMTLSVLYRDAERAEKAARNFMLYEKSITGCYVCNCTPYLSCLLLMGQERQAEELMLKFIYKKIPKSHLWCYFTLLDRSGVHEVEISLPGLETSDLKPKGDAQTADGEESTKLAESAVRVPTLAVAEYMEKRADEFGTLFSKARARFDYEGLKSTYRNCFLAK